mmetsp:Transcript_27318/g.41346  ORF Transcript_27318/g.41346 Transcript_27318/m.41346 type:complete len:406 (+) Transcript_27318:126-1343(+)
MKEYQRPISNRKRQKLLCLPWWIHITTHLLAVMFGATWMALYYHHPDVFESKSNHGMGPTRIVSPPHPTKAAMTTPRRTSKQQPLLFDVLPLIVLEHPWKSPTLHQFVHDAYARVRIKSSTAEDSWSVGPLHVFVPETKPKVLNYLRRELSSLEEPVVVVKTCTEPTKRECFLSLDLWKQMESKSRKVLVLDEYVALCGNPTRTILEYAQQYDWIGAVWSWASKPESAHHRGGNGALSIRNPRHLVAILEQAANEKRTGGNEDMWFVKKLGEWEKNGHLLNNTSKTNLLPEPPILAPQDEQQSFAMETIIPKKKGVTPVGVFHLMRTVSYEDRDYILQLCPEARRLFRVFHDGRCSLDCAANFTKIQNFNQYQRYKKQKEFNACHDVCRVDHPFLEVMANWSMSG